MLNTGRSEGLSKHRVLCDQQGMDGGVFALKQRERPEQTQLSALPVKGKPSGTDTQVKQEMVAKPAPALHTYTVSSEPKTSALPAPTREQTATTPIRFCTGCGMDFYKHTDGASWQFCPSCGQKKLNGV
jgi:hypothetical protein